jgi:hypothetical protein
MPVSPPNPIRTRTNVQVSFWRAKAADEARHPATGAPLFTDPFSAAAAARCVPRAAAAKLEDREPGAGVGLRVQWMGVRTAEIDARVLEAARGLVAVAAEGSSLQVVILGEEQHYGSRTGGCACDRAHEQRECAHQPVGPEYRGKAASHVDLGRPPPHLDRPPMGTEPGCTRRRSSCHSGRPKRAHVLLAHHPATAPISRRRPRRARMAPAVAAAARRPRGGLGGRHSPHSGPQGARPGGLCSHGLREARGGV